MQRIAALFAILILCYSCKDNKPEEKTPEQVIAEEGFTEEDEVTQGEYRRYTGTIDGREAVLNIIHYDDIWRGYYYLLHNSIPIEINLSNEQDLAEEQEIISDGSLTFNEFTPDRRMENGIWIINISGDSISGIRLSGGAEAKQSSIQLKENYPEDVQRFGIAYIKDTVRYDSTNPSPAAIYTFQVLLPVGNYEKAGLVRSAIYHSYGCDTASQNGIAGCMAEKRQSYFNLYKSKFDSLGSDYITDWTQNTGYSVLYNQNDFIVLDNNSDEYTGGAHGIYNNKYVNIDRRNKKILRLSEIVASDSTKLIPAIEKEIRAQFEMEEGAVLSDYLLVDELYIPDNFYINDRGITFVYGLYEIASYAEGIVKVFIPYSNIMHLLTPQFKERMGWEQSIAYNK